MWAGHLSAQENSRVASRYMDGRSQAVLRMEIEDEGLVMPCATGPDSCDTYGAREAVVVEYDGTYYLHYDGAGKTGSPAWRPAKTCAIGKNTDYN